jgi:hypothetical protein
MVIHPSYPFSAKMNEIFNPEPSVRRCSNSDVNEDAAALRNSWPSYRDGKMLEVWRDSKGSFFTYGERQNHAKMLIDTLGAARAWDFKAEIKAMETIKRHLTEWAYQAYVMTGTFLETSPKSHVIYLFRRLRPTLAMTAQPDMRDWRRHKDPGGVRFLCALCLHPIGYYDGSWGGALVPTDDVIAHLLLMRGDEHRFWKDANHHSVWAPEAGV